jgi:hypothetical protein
MSHTGAKLIYQLFALALAMTGFRLLEAYGSWQVSLGVFLCIWANNIK